MRSSSMFIQFRCTAKKCGNIDEVLHQYNPWTEPPKCSKCGESTDIANEDTSVEVGISFRGIGSPGNGPPSVKKMFPNASKHPTVGPWLEKRIEQNRKTGK